MVYLDYSATTPVNEEVIATYSEACRKYIGNPNSIHKLGRESKEAIDNATSKIAKLLNIKESEIIYTSGASEANNTIIKGIAAKHSKGRIITTQLEHSSVIAPCSYLGNKGYDIQFVKLNKDGQVDLDNLKELIDDNTILVSIAGVNSELGIKEPLLEISKIVHEHEGCIFHSDMTQCLGKIPVDLSYVDVASFSAQKFYGMKGIGFIYKKEGISFEPLIHGGKSTTVYRSGTPALPLILSLEKALTLAYQNAEEKLEHVKNLNNYLLTKLRKLDVDINSTEKSIYHIVNFSLREIDNKEMLKSLEQDDIYLSTQTACALGNYSLAIYSLYNDTKRASSSMRVSISYLTTKEEIDYFINSLQKNIALLGGNHESN